MMGATVQLRLAEFLGGRPGEEVAGYRLSTHRLRPEETSQTDFVRILESLPDGGWVDFWCPSRRARGTFVAETTDEVWHWHWEEEDGLKMRYRISVLPRPERVYSGVIVQRAKLGTVRFFRPVDVEIHRERGTFTCPFCGEELPLDRMQEHLLEEMRKLPVRFRPGAKITPDIAEAARRGYNWGAWVEWEELGEVRESFASRSPAYMSRRLSDIMGGAEVEVWIHEPLAPPSPPRRVELVPPPPPPPKPPPPPEFRPIIVPEVLEPTWAAGVPEEVRREVEEKVPGVRVNWEAVRRRVTRTALSWRRTHEGLWRCPICGEEVPAEEIVRHWTRVHGLPPETLMAPVPGREKKPIAVIEEVPRRRAPPTVEAERPPQEVEVELVEMGAE
jgi:predicted RNA-binding Zn-ribbon protein involved in translation (DUF1610 family)